MSRIIVRRYKQRRRILGCFAEPLSPRTVLWAQQDAENESKRIADLARYVSSLNLTRKFIKRCYHNLRSLLEMLSTTPSWVVARASPRKHRERRLVFAHRVRVSGIALLAITIGNRVHFPGSCFEWLLLDKRCLLHLSIRQVQSRVMVRPWISQLRLPWFGSRQCLWWRSFFSWEVHGWRHPVALSLFVLL